MPEEKDPPPQSPPEQPTLLGSTAPDEMFARAMQTVRMTGGAGTWEPPDLEEAARLFPGYEVFKLLGRGGMGAVYQAREIELDRPVAIKLLPLEISVDKDFADRFRREARAMARLHHSNIITVFAFGATPEGHLYFVMEYVEGANLADVIRQVGLNEAQALSILEQICTALAYAHSKGIVHRDIKPANVMIDTDSHVKVADFGLARLTGSGAEQMGHTTTGMVMGTPDYMAPEQTRAMNVDHRADIYSLGVMLYEMLCREVPKGIFQPPSQRTGCDPRIDEIVIKAMQQAPDHRYQATAEMQSDVIAARTPVVVPALKTTEAISQPARVKSRIPLYAGLGAAVLAVAALLFLALGKGRIPFFRMRPTAAPQFGPVSSEGWTNLISRVDVKRDSLMAPWTLENGVLRSPQRIVAKDEDTPGSHQMLAFPIRNPPRNYDLRYRLTRNAHGFAVAVPFVRGTEAADLRIDGGHGFRLAARKSPGKPAKGKQEPLRLGIGERHELLIEVRERRVRISLDGTVLVDQLGPLPEGQRDGAFYPPARTKDPIIGLGVCGGDITVHSAEIREVDKGGMPIPAKTPPAPGSPSAATKEAPSLRSTI